MSRTGPMIERSLDRLERWIERHDYKGYEPFDGLTSYLNHLTLKNRIAGQVLQQAVRRFPLNLRPMLGIKPLESTKGRGYVAWGYLKRYQVDRNEAYRDKAFASLDWLDKDRPPLYSKHSWGNHFLYASRGGYIRRHESTIVWTGLIGQVFLEAYALFGGDRHRQVIESVADWMMGLPREETKDGLCLSYIMSRQTSIHNSNMIGAAFLAGASAVTGRPEYRQVARRAMAYSCAGQLPDGAWYYGEDPTYHWIDAFHTGYNLDALKRYQAASGDESFSEHLTKGYRYFVDRFFEPSGRVKYYFNRAAPIDIQCASQAIDTLLHFFPEDPDSLSMANRSAAWYINHMQNRDGHFHFRRYRSGFSNRAAMIHWGQATMHKALAHLLLRNRLAEWPAAADASK